MTSVRENMLTVLGSKEGGRMSPTPTSLPRYRSAGKFQSERRANQRYLITLEVEYKVPSGNGAQRKGFGRTINISSGGVLLDTSDPLPSRGPIQLSISWPFLLDWSTPLKLVMHGEVVRILGNRIAVEVTQHAFRIAASA